MQVWRCTVRSRRLKNSTWFSQECWKSAVSSIFLLAVSSAVVSTAKLSYRRCEIELTWSVSFLKSISCSCACFLTLNKRLAPLHKSKKACYKTSWRVQTDSNEAEERERKTKERERKRMAVCDLSSLSLALVKEFSGLVGWREPLLLQNEPEEEKVEPLLLCGHFEREQIYVPPLASEERHADTSNEMELMKRQRA